MTVFETIHAPDNLREAWKRVRANRPPPGIDRVRCEEFEATIDFNLQRLQAQLRDESYRPLPVCVFQERKASGKTRTLGVSTIRDRVAQQAVVLVLGPRFERHFLPCSHAYRPGKSALGAVTAATRCISDGALWLLQMDVEKFFDTMDHTILLDLIGRVIDEKPLLRLISRLLKARIFREMGLFDQLVGTQQGSGLSPLLSNIYLHPVDRLLFDRHQSRYLRYSDDIALFAADEDTLVAARELIERALAEVRLTVNPAKTSIRHVSQGVIYLGFHLDASGRGPAKKSVEALEARLSRYDRIPRDAPFADTLDEVAAILRGWHGYYGTLKPIRPMNLVSLIALARFSLETAGTPNHARELLKSAETFERTHAEACLVLGELFATLGLENQAIREYARALELDPSLDLARERIRRIEAGADDRDLHQAIEKIRLTLYHNPHYRDGYLKLAEYYGRLGLHGFAEKAHLKALELDDDTEEIPPAERRRTEAEGSPESWNGPLAEFLPEQDESISGVRASSPSPSPFPARSSSDAFDAHSIDLDLFLRLFTGRHDAHAIQWVDEQGRWGFARVERPIKARDAMAHLRGERTLAVYPVTASDTVHFITFDVDTARRLILESAPERLEEFRERAHADILRIRATAESLGAEVVIEDSGYKGRHGWLFFGRATEATLAVRMGTEIMRRAGGPSEGMIWELFPMGKSERHRSLIKLPLGINRKNGRRCLLLEEDGSPSGDQGGRLRGIRGTDPGVLRAALFGAMGGQAESEWPWIGNPPTTRTTTPRPLPMRPGEPCPPTERARMSPD